MPCVRWWTERDPLCEVAKSQEDLWQYQKQLKETQQEVARVEGELKRYKAIAAAASAGRHASRRATSTA